MKAPARRIENKRGGDAAQEEVFRAECIRVGGKKPGDSTVGNARRRGPGDPPGDKEFPFGCTDASEPVNGKQKMREKKK